MAPGVLANLVVFLCNKNHCPWRSNFTYDHCKYSEILLHYRNSVLWTPLDCAAAKGWTKTVKVLLDADAPIDPMDKSKVQS